MTENTEDAGTLAYLQDTASQAGLADHADRYRGRRARATTAASSISTTAPIELAFKLYPWEWMFHDAFGAKLASAPTRWIEPPWKAILSNKGILPLLWEMFPKHPNLLPAYFEDDPKAAMLGTSFVRKPLYSREGANVALVSAGTTLVEQEGPYGAEGFHPAGLRAAAELLRSIPGGRKLAGRSHAMRPVDPRGREPDHRQYVAVPAARDSV